MKMFSEELDLRSKWLGLKMLRKGYTPTPHHRRQANGNHISLHNRAQEAAKYLANTQWGEGETTGEAQRREKVITIPVDIKTTAIEKDEVIAAIKKLNNYNVVVQTEQRQNYSKHSQAPQVTKSENS